MRYKLCPLHTNYNLYKNQKLIHSVTNRKQLEKLIIKELETADIKELFVISHTDNKIEDLDVPKPIIRRY